MHRGKKEKKSQDTIRKHRSHTGSLSLALSFDNCFSWNSYYILKSQITSNHRCRGSEKDLCIEKKINVRRLNKQCLCIFERKKNLSVLGYETVLNWHRQFLLKNSRWHVDEPATHTHEKKLTEHPVDVLLYWGDDTHKNIRDFRWMHSRPFNRLLSEEDIFFITWFLAKVVFEQMSFNIIKPTETRAWVLACSCLQASSDKYHFSKQCSLSTNGESNPIRSWTVIMYWNLRVWKQILLNFINIFGKFVFFLH